MLFSLRSISVTVILLFCLLQIASAADTSDPSKTPELSAANQLFRAGKFAEAEVSYRALLKKDSTLLPAQVGLVRAMLREQKIDEALESVNTALAVQPNSAALLAAKGDVHFRRAEMGEAETAYFSARKLRPEGSQCLPRSCKAVSLLLALPESLRPATDRSSNCAG